MRLSKPAVSSVCAKYKIPIALLSIGLTIMSVVALGPRQAARRSPSIGNAKIVDLYRKVPLSFERNDGQTDAQVKFLARGDG